MLGEYCDRCHVPLVKHRQTEEKVCVSCGGHGEGEPRSTPLAVTAATTPHESFDPRSDDRLGPFARSPSGTMEGGPGYTKADFGACCERHAWD